MPYFVITVSILYFSAAQTRTIDAMESLLPCCAAVRFFSYHFIPFCRFLISFQSCFSESFSAVKISDFSFFISFQFSRNILCNEDFLFFNISFHFSWIIFFSEDFQNIFFPFHSIFPESFSLVKISDVSFSISFHFSWIIFFSEDFQNIFPISFHFSWIIFFSEDFQRFLFPFHSIFPESFSMVKISDVSFSISFHFSWIIFFSEDFRIFFSHFIPFFLDHFLW